MRRFTHIPEQRRDPQMPRVAKIRLGIKAKAGSGKEYPKEVDYFVLTDCPEVAKVYGQAPKELPILLPLENVDAIIPHRFAFWGSDAGLKCQGDGNVYIRVNRESGEMEEGECPTPSECDFCISEKYNKPMCIRQGTLNVMLPGVSMAGIYQIDTTSWHAIQGILDDLAYIRSLCGRVSLLTIGNRCLLKLVRKPTETHHDGHKRVHFPMRIVLAATQDEIWMIRKRATSHAITDGPKTTAIVKPGDIPEPTAPVDLLPQGHLEHEPSAPVTRKPPKTVKSETKPVIEETQPAEDEPEVLPDETITPEPETTEDAEQPEIVDVFEKKPEKSAQQPKPTATKPTRKTSNVDDF